MTGLMHEKEFSRKAFVKGGGALIVGVTALSAVAGKASAANGLTPFATRGPGDYLPDINAIDTWITITPQNTCIVTHGETELGHGTPTGILMLTAEELNMDFSQMIYAHPESWLNVTGGGSGSSGISSRSTSIRAAAAYAKQILLGMASTKLGVPVANLTVASGVITGGGKSVKYGDLIGGKLFSYTMSTNNGGQTSATPGQGIAKPVSQYTVVGKSFPRIDIPAKALGTYTYIQNVRIPGMLHGRRVRPRGCGANTALNDRPVSVDASSISHIPGAQVVQIQNWLGVVAPKEYDAIQAAAQLKVVWQSDPKLPGSGNFWGWLRKMGDTDAPEPGPLHGPVRPCRREPRRRSEDGLCDLQVPLQQLHADRPALRGRRRQCRCRTRQRCTSRRRPSPAFRRTSPASSTASPAARCRPRTAASSGTKARARSAAGRRVRSTRRQ